MSFRKLKEFNISMVGKQLWRLIENPDSLLGRVLKARYFPRHGILDAGKVGNQSSFWSGLVAAKDCLKAGFRKHIGVGRETPIYGGNWWPSVDKLHPISCRDDRFRDATVSELFFEGAQVWNEAVVRAVFDEEEAEQMLSIPLARSSREGAVYWCPEQKGSFSVSSAYKFLCEGSFEVDTNSMVWSRLWKLKVPPKVKIFLWKACRNFLPTRDRLRQRQMEISGICPVCNFETETIIHCLISCGLARDCWQRLGVPIISPGERGFIEWIEKIVSGDLEVEVEEVVVVLWHLWFNRNKIIWRNENGSAAGIIGAARSCLTAWREAQVRNDIGARVGRLHLEEKWVKPQNGVLKCNIDAAVFPGQRKIGCGAVVRDFEGTVVAAMCGEVGRVADPSMAELLSLREVLSWVRRKGWKEIEFEMDAQTVVLAVTGTQKDESIFGAVVEDCRQLLKEVSGSSMRFVRRSANQVAHTLARASGSIADSKYWMNCIPIFIRNVITMDLVE